MSTYSLASAGSALLIKPVTRYKVKSCSYYPRPHQREPTALCLAVQTLRPGFWTPNSYLVGASIPWPGIPYTRDPLHFSRLSLWHLPSSHTDWPPPYLIHFHSGLLLGSHEGPGSSGCSLAKRIGKWGLPGTTYSPSSPTTVSVSPSLFLPLVLLVLSSTAQ